MNCDDLSLFSVRRCAPVLLVWYGGGLRNPAPVDRWFICLFIGFQPSKVVQDFLHPKNVNHSTSLVLWVIFVNFAHKPRRYLATKVRKSAWHGKPSWSPSMCHENPMKSLFSWHPNEIQFLHPISIPWKPNSIPWIHIKTPLRSLEFGMGPLWHGAGPSTGRKCTCSRAPATPQRLRTISWLSPTGWRVYPLVN